MSDKKELDLAELKAKADGLGVEYKPNITAASLDKKIKKFIVDNASESSETKELSKQEVIANIRKEAKKKVRVRITCLNPNKKDWRGEVITAGNNYVGDIKEFVPFNAQKNGWHVYQTTLDVLRERKFQAFVTKRSQNGIEERKGVLENEFSIEILPALSKKEITALANQQASRAGELED